MHQPPPFRPRAGRTWPALLVGVLLLAVATGFALRRLARPEGDDPAGWAPAGQPARAGEIIVSVTGAELGPVVLRSPLNMMEPGPYLRVRLGVRLVGEAGRLNFRSWGSRGLATAVDDLGNQYVGQFASPYRVEGRAHDLSVSPGQTADDLVVLPPPPAAARMVRLQLEAQTGMGDEPIRLTIPTSTLQPATVQAATRPAD